MGRNIFEFIHGILSGWRRVFGRADVAPRIEPKLGVRLISSTVDVEPLISKRLSPNVMILTTDRFRRANHFFHKGLCPHCRSKGTVHVEPLTDTMVCGVCGEGWDTSMRVTITHFRGVIRADIRQYYDNGDRTDKLARHVG